MHLPTVKPDNVDDISICNETSQKQLHCLIEMNN